MEVAALAEPRTLADLDRVIERRNASRLEVNQTAYNRVRNPKEIKNLLITRDQVLRELDLVEADQPSSSGVIRDFLGGIGLITRFGFDDTLTSAGHALVAETLPAARRRAA